jgi:hypothetical protein
MLSRVWSGDASRGWQEVCMNAAIVGRAGIYVRNKKLLGFTTDYKDLMNGLPQLSVLS